jgi:hypothetical protein
MTLERTVTHYLLPDDDPENWVPLHFVTRDATNRYFFAFEDVPLSKRDIEVRESDGEIERIIEWPIFEGQQLWKTPAGEIWLASTADPFDDFKRVLLKQAPLPEIVSKKEIIVKRCYKDGASPSNAFLIYVPDDFVEGKIYSEFGDFVADQLATMNAAQILRSAGLISKWQVLSNILAEHTVDFCGMPFYLDPTRREQFAVVQFGQLETFTAYFEQRSRILAPGTPLFQDKLETARRILESLNHTPGLRYGILQDTAASAEVLRIFRLTPALADRLFIGSNITEMRRWIDSQDSKTETRVIICDHSQAEELDQLKSHTATLREPRAFEHGTPRATMRFTCPLPVGFVYPRRDERWRDDIRIATAKAIEKIVLQNQNYEKLQEDLSPLRIQLLPQQELVDSLSIRSRGRAVI